MDSPFTEDSAERKKFPVYSGFVKYFPKAMAMVARISFDNNQKHNPGATEVLWNRAVSGDEPDAMMRHIIDRDWGQVAWRAMANLEKEIENGYEGGGTDGKEKT